jgi:hypothetical protein
MQRYITITTLFTMFSLPSLLQALEKDPDFTVALQSNPTVIHLKGLKEFAGSVKEFASSVNIVTQEIKKIPTYINHAQQTIQMAGIILIGCTLFGAATYNLIKKDGQKWNDRILDISFMGLGVALVLFSPSLARYMNPLSISV